MALVVLSAVLLLTGCQTYQQKTSETKGLWSSGHLEAAGADYTRKADKAQGGKDALVYRLEQAMALVEAGATRLGTASTGSLLQAAEAALR